MSTARTNQDHSTLSRRAAMTMVAGVATGLCAARLAQAQPGASPAAAPQTPPESPVPAEPATFFDWKPARERAMVAFGAGGNALVVRGSKGVLLVDCKNSPYGEGIRREAQAAVGSALTIVLNSHHHADHTGGNHAMRDLPLLAHEKAIPRVRAQLNRYISQVKEAVPQLADKKGPAKDKVLADTKALHDRMTTLSADEFAPRTAVGDGHEINLGGVRAVLTHFGPGHTDNDLVIHLPEINVIHAADLLFHQRHPFVDRDSGADTRSWERALEAVIAMCDAKTVVIPGHGELTDVSGLRGQIAYFQAARAFVAGAIKEGKDRKTILESKVPGTEALAGSGTMALSALYEEAKAG